MQMIKELQIKLANGYISPAIKHNIVCNRSNTQKTTVPAKHEDLRSLRTEIKYLQKGIKRSIRQSEERKREKILERASDKGSKGFWRAIKELTNDHESKQKTGDYPNLNNKVSQADQKKSELFKQLLKDTMKNHTPGFIRNC